MRPEKSCQPVLHIWARVGDGVPGPAVAGRSVAGSAASLLHASLNQLTGPPLAAVSVIAP